MSCNANWTKRWLAAATLLVGAALALPAQAQEPAPPRVALTEISGTPGSSLMIPLYFTPDPKTPIRSITVDIDYVSNNLIYKKLSPGTAAEEANVEIAAELKEGAADAKGVKRSTLEIKASSKDALPDGLLAYLLFDISLDAKPFTIKLNTSVPSAQDASSKNVKVNAESGSVQVEVIDVMPEGTCFFFSH